VTQLGGAPQAAGRAKPSPNIYTVLALVAMVALGTAIGFVLYRSAELFGSIGELFNFSNTAAMLTATL
jgi:hypothetical protein